METVRQTVDIRIILQQLGLKEELFKIDIHDMDAWNRNDMEESSGDGSQEEPAD